MSLCKIISLVESKHLVVFSLKPENCTNKRLLPLCLITQSLTMRDTPSLCTFKEAKRRVLT